MKYAMNTYPDNHKNPVKFQNHMSVVKVTGPEL